jgi:hypothetical protein
MKPQMSARNGTAIFEMRAAYERIDVDTQKEEGPSRNEKALPVKELASEV